MQSRGLGRFYAVDRMVRKEHLRGDLPTTREAYGNLLNIALPSVCEMVLTSLIGSVDTMMVGTMGTNAIAAVGLTGQPRMLMLCIFFAMNTGVLIVALTAILMSLALAFSKELMVFAGAKEDTVDMANAYFRILAWFLPVNALTMCINAAQRGVGNTRITMYVNIAANLVNVLFNYLLIGGNLGFPAMGVEGAAIATVIGFCVGLVLSIISLAAGRDRFLRLSFHDNWRLNREAMSGIVKLGGNAMIEQVALRFGFFLYARIVADLGTDAFAAHQVCMQFLNLSFTFGDGIGVAGTSLVGQMLGKKRPDLSTVYGKCSQRLALTTALILATNIVVFRYPLLRLFIDPAADGYVYQLAAQVMLVVALFQPFQTSSVVFSGCLRGAGDTKYVAVVMMLCVACVRPVCALLAVHVLGMDLVGAWMASLVDMILRMTLVARRFSGGKWHDIKV